MGNNFINRKAGIILIGLFMFLIINCSVSNKQEELNRDKSTKSKTEVDGDHDEGGDHVVLSAQAMGLADITIDSVRSDRVPVKMVFPGEIDFNEERYRRIIPRFPGIAGKIYKKMGDKVLKGEILAKIHSNESFTSYNIFSEISGIVIKRDIAPGEFTSEGQVIFEIADLSTVWVRMNIFPPSIKHLKTGMDVRVLIIDGNKSADCKIVSIVPLINRETRCMTAMAELDNRDNEWHPGAFVNTEVIINSQPEVPVVFSESIQFLNEESVVFVPEKDNEFHVVHVITGRTDGTITEIIKGLKSGDKYVRKGAFELKAKIVTGTMGGHAGHGH